MTQTPQAKTGHVLDAATAALSHTVRSARALVTELSRAGKNEQAKLLLSHVMRAETVVQTEIADMPLSKAQQCLEALTIEVRDAMQRAREVSTPAPAPVAPAPSDEDEDANPDAGWISLSAAAQLVGKTDAAICIAVKAGKLKSRPSAARKNGKEVRRADVLALFKKKERSAPHPAPTVKPVKEQPAARSVRHITLSAGNDQTDTKLQRFQEVSVLDVKWWHEAKTPPAVINDWQVAA